MSAKKKNTKKTSTKPKTKSTKLDSTKTKNYNSSKQDVSENVRLDSLTANLPTDLPAEARQKLEEIKVILGKYQERIVSKFQGYIMGVSLLPPNQPEKGKELTKEEKDAINVLVLLDDADSKKMTKEELREKLTKIITITAEEIDKKLKNIS